MNNQNEGLCPICGECVRLTGRYTANGRLIGTCGDAFTLRQWIGNEESAPQQNGHVLVELEIFGDETCVVSLAALKTAARHFARVHKQLKNDGAESGATITHQSEETPCKTPITAQFAQTGTGVS